ncbi:MAG TPA: xylulokinase [Treponemataceae bacterium]|nr:xylulokinase [Treponemataceae bacterium]HOS35880.1 xylulokinase [Treponemataceae bacterium]HOU38125.1 xylulokinase [Treponemataceae bacterium]HPL92043.1 xylulokinase [Treponemataceae bacterium]HQF73024.1 xylulokinase [Treponemataceae bacterium]
MTEVEDMKTVAGIDMGTQSMKVILYNWETKEIVAKTQEPVDLIAKNDGTREQKAEWYDEALTKCFAGFTEEQRKSIQAVGVSGHQHGFVPLDKDGKALYNVKLWNDTSTVEECNILTEAAGGNDAVISEVCNLMLPGFTAPKILWLKRHKPEAFAQLRYIMLPHDYLNFLLTGNYVAECGDASGTALFNGIRRQWSEKICNLVDPGLIKLLPDLIESEKPAGKISREAAARFGLPGDIPVSSGGGDNMMGAIGTGTVRDGFLTMSLGTSGTLYGYSDSPVSDPEKGLSGFSSSTGGYLPLLCTMNCTVATEETRKLFGLGVKEFDECASKAPIGSEGVVFLPFFNGERTPNLPNGRASINGLNAANSSRENIARAAMESAIFGMRIGLEAFQALGFRAKEIRLIGGGAKSKIWRSIAANVMDLPVKLPASDEAAAMGGAVQALWCLMNLEGNKISIGELTDEHITINEDQCINPDPASVAAYNKAYAEYNRYLGALAPLYK